MNVLKRITIFIALSCMVIIPLSAYAVVAGGMASINRNFPYQPGGFNDMEFTITITAEPGYNGRTYWAHQFGFLDGESGYVGLQNRSGYEKALNFSIWGATGWQNANGSNCAFFSHEGSGVQCWINYSWQEGITYQITVARAGTSAWQATIKNTKTNVTTAVATIQVPQSYGGLSSLSEWVENFAQGNDQLPSCSAVPQAIAVYGVPKANGGSVFPTYSSSTTYGNCYAVARAVCTNEQICTLGANPAAPQQQIQIKNSYSGFCLDMLAAGSNAGLYTCTRNGNQLFTHDGTYRFHKDNAAESCLTVDPNSRVVSAACDNSAKQQWLSINRTSAYFNPGTGLCMDPLNNAVILAPIRVYSCLENDLQRWSTQP